MSGTVTFPEFIKQMQALPEAIERANRLGVNRAALVVTNEIRDSLRAVSGDMRLSGVGRRGARIGARYDVKGTSNPTALIRATGPVHLIERRTGGHDIAPRSKKRRAVSFNGIARRHVHHPGTAGRRAWSRGVEAGVPRGVQEFGDVWRQTVQKVF